MLEIIIAILGSAVAGAWDLKTTEVPDEIPILMVVSGLFIWGISGLRTGNFFPFAVSFFVGTSVLIAGLLLYKAGKWGGADAWILAAIFYLIPLYNNRIFLLDYISNLVWVSAAFTMAYAITLGIRNRHVFGHFLADLKKNAVAFIALPVAAFAVFTLALRGTPIASTFPGTLIFILLFLLVIFWRYARIIETEVFTKKIPASQLKTGDVLEDMVWRGLTYEEVARIRKSKKFVTIKEGMRFVPVFPLTLIVTLLYGNLLFWFL